MSFHLSSGVWYSSWVPELKKIPSEFLYKPWELDIKYQEELKIIIGKDYPSPIVEHTSARNAALEAFQSLKK